jgi:hypothetical protein
MERSEVQEEVGDGHHKFRGILEVFGRHIPWSGVHGWMRKKACGPVFLAPMRPGWQYTEMFNGGKEFHNEV